MINNTKMYSDTLNGHGKKLVPVLKVDSFKGEQVPETEVKTKNYYQAEFKRSILDQSKEYPLPVPVISIVQNDTILPLLTLKSFSLWQGKQKSKKTTGLALAVAGFIKGNTINQATQFVGSVEGTAFFFDNEQGESYAARTMKLILKLAGVDTSPKLVYCDLREYPPLERVEIIKAGIESTPNVKLVIIDGLVDLLNDFMDAKEGHLTTTEILKLCSAYNIHVAGVLHQNKADKNARAHIGTISSQKCEVEISTEVDPNDRNQSFVICVNSRGLPFEQFAIRWDRGCLPCINQDWNAGKPEDAKTIKNFKRSKDVAESIFRPFSAFSHTEAINAIMNTSLKSESTAKRILKDYIGWNLVSKGDDGNYRINIDKGSRVHEGSNEGL